MKEEWRGLLAELCLPHMDGPHRIEEKTLR